jgi:hypothetical protein
VTARGTRNAAWWSKIKIDPRDEHLLSEYAISCEPIRGKRYLRLRAKCRTTGKIHVLARLILQPPAGFVVDHINGDPLDNRRSNLRVCTPLENGANTRSRYGSSRFKGVCRWRDGLWSAKVYSRGQQKWLGVFQDEIAAAKAHDEAARELHGRFAALNFPGPGEVSGLRWGE